jgi:hypothetical protein
MGSAPAAQPAATAGEGTLRPGGRKPPHKKGQAAAALIRHGSAEQAAARRVISDSTLGNRLKDAAVPAAYRQARRALVDDAVRVLQRANRADVARW